MKGDKIFIAPKIAAVGLTESEARERYDMQVGEYRETVKGRITESRGLAKGIVDEQTKKILGFHNIGPRAPLLLQEVNMISLGGTIDDITGSIHTFPTLSKLITIALTRLEKKR